MRVLILTCAAVLATLPQGAEAQRRGGERIRIERHDEGSRGNAERALRDRERLSLTGEQVAQLEALRSETVERASRRAAETRELMSRARAGLVEDEALREQLRTARTADREARTQSRERLEGILTEDQRTRLRQSTRRSEMRRTAPRGRDAVRSPRAAMRRGAPAAGAWRNRSMRPWQGRPPVRRPRR